MAGEGLFFTGTILKNNRNLLEEEAARQQLEMQREELELKKQLAADKRKEARKKNTPKALDFNTSSMGPDMGPVLQSDALDYQKAVNANSLDEEGGDLEAMNSRSSRESKLKVDANIYNEVWKDVSANRTLSRGSNRGTLRTNSEGGYTFEDSYQSFLENIQIMSPEDAYKLYSERESDINKTEWDNPISALYKDGVTLKTTNRTDGSAFEEYTGFSSIAKKLEEKLTPDKNGNWDNPTYKKLYTGQEGLISVEGSESRLSYPAAFAFETRGIGLEPDDTTFTDKLSPKNEAYEPELAAEYIQWIKNRSEEEARKDFPKRETKGKAKDEKDSTALSQDRIDFFMSDSEETEPYGLSELKVSPNFGEDITDAGIVVSLTKASPIKEQGEVKLQEFNDLFDVANSEGTDVPVQGKVSWVGMTVSGKTVARVEFSGQSFLIDLADISSEQQEVKTGSTTALDLFKLAESASTKSSDWKTSWKK